MLTKSEILGNKLLEKGRMYFYIILINQQINESNIDVLLCIPVSRMVLKTFGIGISKNLFQAKIKGVGGG